MRTSAELNVWKEASLTFAAVLPLNTLQCGSGRDGFTIAFRSTVIATGRRTYRVDVNWSRMVDDQSFFRQLHTRFPEHLQ